MKHLIIAMLMCVGIAANAQEKKDSSEVIFVEVPGEKIIVVKDMYLCHIPIEKVFVGGGIYKANSKGNSISDSKLVGKIKNTAVMGFNPSTLKMWIIAPSDNHQEVEQAVQAYLGEMSSLKNEYFDGCKGDTLYFKASQENVVQRDSVIAAFAEEAWQGLSKFCCKKVASYDPYTDTAEIKSYGWGNSEMTKGINVWLLNNYIKKKTKGHFCNVDDFQKALKAGDEEAVKYAKKMK